MKKIDYKKELKELYSGKLNQQVVVDVPKMNFLMIDGGGGPGSQEYIEGVQALYPVAYTIKFMVKAEIEKDFGVMPLEGLWYMEDMEKFSEKVKDQWLWTSMIMQPEIVTNTMFERAIAQVAEKKNPKNLDKVRFEAYHEGRSAQVMYVGPYSEETETILQLHEFIEEQGGKLDMTNKHHHEIYLSDPRRTDVSKLKTIIRQPF